LRLTPASVPACAPGVPAAAIAAAAAAAAAATTTSLVVPRAVGRRVLALLLPVLLLLFQPLLREFLLRDVVEANPAALSPAPRQAAFRPVRRPLRRHPVVPPAAVVAVLPPLEPFKLKASVAPMARSSSWNDGELVIPFCNDWLATDNAICFMLDTDDAEMIVCTGGALLDVLLLRFGDSGDDESAVGCCGCGCWLRLRLLRVLLVRRQLRVRLLLAASDCCNYSAT